jgi:hypothetical protein
MTSTLAPSSSEHAKATGTGLAQRRATKHLPSGFLLRRGRQADPISEGNPYVVIATDGQILGLSAQGVSPQQFVEEQ